jgi:F420 biosynthesis protein FbiB-like protein
MSHVSDAIKERRSIRKYSTNPVPQEAIEEVLVAAGWAPSAHNAQPWRFIVLADPAVKRELAEAMAEAWAADMAQDGSKVDVETQKARVERFATAPVLILACTTMDGMARQPDMERLSVERDLALQSLAAALENMLLTAHAEGLGACWFCAPAFCKETVRKVLGIPADVEPQALIAMGYPAEAPPVPTKNRLGDFCFKDKWGGKF